MPYFRRATIELCLFLLTATAAAAEPVTLPGTEQFDLEARSGGAYRIFVAAPSGSPPEAGWPVIYSSDGNANFPILLAAVRRQTMGGAPALVVGIGYPDDDSKAQSERRTFDLTPAASAEFVKALPKGGPALGKSGGQDAFLEFIETELKPQINARYKIDAHQQALFGHSFGGLFVLHVLFTRPESFQTYLASSPSIWWNNRCVLTEEESFTKSLAGKVVNARLLITVGEWEQAPGPHEPPERAAMLAERQMATQAEQLSQRLGASEVKGLSVTFREFPEESHGSVVLPAASRGVRFMLDSQP